MGMKGEGWKVLGLPARSLDNLKKPTYFRRCHRGTRLFIDIIKDFSKSNYFERIPSKILLK